MNIINESQMDYNDKNQIGMINCQLRAILCKYCEGKMSLMLSLDKIHETFKVFEMNSKGWICRKCGYSWASWVAGCSNCNQPETITQHSSTSTHYCPNPKTDGSCGCYSQWKINTP